jgi:hypothetical protein
VFELLQEEVQNHLKTECENGSYTILMIPEMDKDVIKKNGYYKTSDSILTS